MMTKIEFDKQSVKFLGFYDGKMEKKSVRRECVE
jgi:TPP-dependent 2-oxoacid decarboxylase